MNKILYSLALILVLGTGCSSVKSAQSTNSGKIKKEVSKDESSVVYNPETKKYEKVADKPTDTILPPATKKDTVMKKEVIVKKDTQLVMPNKTLLSSNLRESNRKSTYNVSLVLPFNTGDSQNSSTNLSRNSVWAVHFYSGAKLALKKFENTGVKINLNVIDTKNLETSISSLLNRPELLNADLIIGPYSSSQAKILIDFVKDRKTTLVSPYTTSSNPTTANPNYIQANPSIYRHFEALSKHIAANFSADQIVFLTQNTESAKSRTQNFINTLNSFLTPEAKSKIREIVLPDNFLLSSEVKLDSTVTRNNETVFIVPSWDERYVKDVLKKIENGRDGVPVYVYGMPQWQNMDDLKYLMTNLNARISSNVLLNLNNSNVDKFRSEYFDTYAKMPDLEAFSGYDVTSYFFSRLVSQGDFFQKDSRSAEKELYTRFDIKPVMNDQQPGIVDYFENYGLQIMQIKGSGFDILD